jgi:hypothetical protein
MASNSYSFTQISTWSQTRWSAKLAAMIDKRQPALHREGGGGVSVRRILTHTPSTDYIIIGLLWQIEKGRKRRCYKADESF